MAAGPDAEAVAVRREPRTESGSLNRLSSASLGNDFAIQCLLNLVLDPPEADFMGWGHGLVSVPESARRLELTWANCDFPIKH